MRAIDTNVAARYLLRDDERQYGMACAILREPTLVPTTVLLELAWLLTSRYRQPRDVVASALLGLIDLPAVSVADRSTLCWAIDRYAAGADLADMIHIGTARPALRFATFDRRIADDAGASSPIPVETLA